MSEKALIYLVYRKQFIYKLIEMINNMNYICIGYLWSEIQ